MTPAVRIALALCSGLLYALAFPPVDAGWLAWIAIAPLVLAVVDGTPSRGRAFVLGWLAGTIACTALVSSSVAEAALRYFGVATWVAWAAGALAAQLYGALYFGLFAVLARELGRRSLGSDGDGVRRAPLRAALCIAAAWVACELLRSRIGDGCPWILLAHAQHRFPRVLQIADLGGALAVSFVVAFAGALLATVAHVALDGAGVRRRAVLRPVLVLAATIALVLAYGHARVVQWSSRAGETIRVVGIQSNLPDAWRRSLREQPRAVHRMIALTASAARERPALVVWPENAISVVPGASTTGLADAAAVLPAGSALLAGAPRAVQTGPGRAVLHNSAFLVEAGGAERAVYDKVDLTPWAERAPWPLGGWPDLVPPAATGYAGGSGAPLPEVRGRRFGVTICSEALYAERVAAQVRSGATFLVNLANDGWFGDRPAVAQHAAATVLRAVETRRFLVRTTPSGISFVVAPSGEVVARARAGEEALVAGDIVPSEALTLYVRLGDLFGWLCIATVAIALTCARRARARRGRTRIAQDGRASLQSADSASRPRL